MFDKLEDLLVRLEEILSELNEPGVANDPARFQKLMKEQSELQPIVDAYKEYKACQQTVEESLMMLDEESDEEMREMLKEELADAKSRIEELETELKILLLPKDPNDSSVSFLLSADSSVTSVSLTFFSLRFALPDLHPESRQHPASIHISFLILMTLLPL